jgi:hypothetical protein
LLRDMGGSGGCGSITMRAFVSPATKVTDIDSEIRLPFGSSLATVVLKNGVAHVAGARF